MLALIVDDESRSRAHLRLMLEDYCQGIEVVGAAESAQQALEKIPRLKPDVLFLDVQMPGMSGIELAQALEGMKLPIVFVTAYDHYALQALKASAVDYLLKPLKISELQQAVEKLLQRQASGMNDSNGIEVLHHNLRKQGGCDKLRVPWDGGFKVLEVPQIIHLKADNTYTEVYLTSGKILVSMSLGEFEDVIPQGSFFRVHYSHIINMDHMDSFSARDGGQVTMKDGSSVPVSRRRLHAFKEAAEQYFDRP